MTSCVVPSRYVELDTQLRQDAAASEKGPRRSGALLPIEGSSAGFCSCEHLKTTSKLSLLLSRVYGHSCCICSRKFKWPMPQKKKHAARTSR